MSENLTFYNPSVTASRATSLYTREAFFTFRKVGKILLPLIKSVLVKKKGQRIFKFSVLFLFYRSCILKSIKTVLKSDALRLALFALYLFVYALIFVIEFVIMAATCATGEKGIHLVLIKRHRAGVGVGVLIVIVMLTTLAGGGVMYSVFGKIKRHSLILPEARGSERQASIRQLYQDRASS